jgi:hypothetical protein
METSTQTYKHMHMQYICMWLCVCVVVSTRTQTTRPLYALQTKSTLSASKPSGKVCPGTSDVVYSQPPYLLGSPIGWSAPPPCPPLILSHQLPPLSRPHTIQNRRLTVVLCLSGMVSKLWEKVSSHETRMNTFDRRPLAPLFSGSS